MVHRKIGTICGGRIFRSEKLQPGPLALGLHVCDGEEGGDEAPQHLVESEGQVPPVNH